MKKLFALGLVLLLSLTFLVACDNDPTETETEVTPPVTTTDTETEVDPTEDVDPTEPGTTFGGETITIWVDNPRYAEALTAALAAEFPDSTFEFEELGHVDTLDRLMNDGPAGIGADILFIPHNEISDGLNQNLILPLGEALIAEMNGRILESALGTIRHNGNYFGVPLTTESVALFYNRTLLEEYDLEVATTWEEVIEQADTFNNVADNRFILRFDAGNAFHSHFALTAFGFELFGPEHNDPDAINFDTPEAIAGLEFYAQLSDIVPVPAEDLDWANTQGAFEEGIVPYFISGPWSIGYINDSEPDFDWGITLMPTVNGVRPITFSGNQVAVASAFTPYPELVNAVLSFMMSDQAIGYLYDLRGSLPALIDASGVPGLAEDHLQLAILAQAEYSHPMPTIPEMGLFWDPAGSMYTAVWNGLLTPEEASAHAMDEYNAARALADN